jgi:hypothetical protein
MAACRAAATVATLSVTREQRARRGVSFSGAEMRNLPGALRVWACHPGREHALAENEFDVFLSRTRKFIGSYLRIRLG